jgi:hypothetical protein
MDISSVSPVSGTQSASYGVNTQNTSRQLEQAELAGRVQNDRPPEEAEEAQRPAEEPAEDTYEAGGGESVRANRPQPEQQRQDNAAQEELEEDETAEVNAYASNARAVEVQNDVLGTSFDVSQ